jgi:putative FmdB family regulatory protein
MPVYEFTCQRCHQAFEVVRPMADASTSVTCPHCQATEVERRWSRVSAVTSKKS